MNLKALSIEERLEARDALLLQLNNGLGPARDRLDWWAESLFGGDRRLLNKWLTSVSPGQQRLPLQLFEQDLDLSNFSAPEGWMWLHFLKRINSNTSPHDALTSATGEGPIAHAINGYMREARLATRTTIAIAVRDGLSIDSDIVTTSFLSSLRQRLESIARPTLTMAINVERISGRLDGETAEERTEHFSRRLRDGSQRALILSRFPVLDRLLAEVTIDSLSAFDEMVSHYVGDIDAISSTFGLSSLKVQNIQFGLGDPHRRGRRVAKFSVGGVNLIYKPRTLATDVAFNEFIDNINPYLRDALRPLLVVSRSDHGWTEFIEARDCDSEDDVSRCFRRIGSLLCMMYLIGGGDVHFENLICSSDDPLMVDLETLMSPWPALKERPESLQSRMHADGLLRIGYLPNPAYIRGALVDLSAGGAVSIQHVSSFLASSEISRDDAHYERAMGMLPLGDNTPTLKGQRVAGREYVGDIIDGFSTAYEAVLHNRDDVLGGEFLEKLMNTQFRWVPKSTNFYGDLLRASLHPRALRDSLEREMVFSPLLQDHRFSARHSLALISSEVDDLRACDIPIFHGKGGSLDAYDSRGNVIPGVFAHSGVDTISYRLDRMGGSDLIRHTSFISDAFSASDLTCSTAARHVRRLRPASTNPAECASEIAWRLQRSVYIGDGMPLWHSVKKLDNRVSSVRVGDFSLYDGVAGIGIFLSEYSRSHNDPDARRLALQCLRACRMKGALTAAASIGAFDGIAGLVFGELRMSQALGVAYDLRGLKKRLSMIAQAAPNDILLDVISGSAGAALVALRAAEVHELSDVALSAATACLKRLEAKAEHKDDLAAWRSAHFDLPLTGFSHGASGAALALASGAAALGENAWRDLAWAALRYENSTFDADRRRWPDLRHENAYSMAWCHGTPGITLARQLIAELNLAATPEFVASDIDLGLTAICDCPSSETPAHCLCHGSLGNLDPLLRAGPTRRQEATRTAQKLCEEAQLLGWQADPALNVPGLMTGISGIGLNLLRVANPQVGSVLALELQSPWRTVPEISGREESEKRVHAKAARRLAQV